MTYTGYEVAAVVRVVDGDTYDLLLARTVDFGFYLTTRNTWHVRVRLYGVDAWETRDPLGPQATADAAAWLEAAGDQLRADTYKADSFGRWLADLYRADTGEHLAAYLREHGDTTPSRWDMA